MLKNNWFDANNKCGDDFNIYSSYTDALTNKNPWKYCNFNDAGVGFPRDCGLSGLVGGQWTSWVRNRKATFCIGKDKINFVFVKILLTSRLQGKMSQTFSECTEVNTSLILVIFEF